MKTTTADVTNISEIEMRSGREVKREKERERKVEGEIKRRDCLKSS